MFGHNQIRGQSTFSEAEGRLLVTSLFLTLQGEGPFSGRPSFFVRLAHCNLACSFCDTYFDKGDWFDIPVLADSIGQRIKEAYNGSVPEWADLWNSRSDGDLRQVVLVLTGGEPMLQKAITPFLHRMQNEFRWTQIESNGILMQDIPSSTILVVSPKCREKGGEVGGYIRPPDRVMSRADCLKFVVSADPTSPYHQIPTWALRWHDQSGKPVYVSPMNVYNRMPGEFRLIQASGDDMNMETRSKVVEKVSFWEEGLLDMKQNRQNHEYAGQLALDHGLYLSLQQHLYASMA